MPLMVALDTERVVPLVDQAKAKTKLPPAGKFNPEMVIVVAVSSALAPAVTRPTCGIASANSMAWETALIYVSPVPEIIHDVVAIFSAVAMPFAARVRDPVVPVPANVMVSDVMAIVTVLIWLTKVMAVPTG